MTGGDGFSQTKLEHKQLDDDYDAFIDKNSYKVARLQKALG